jgi:hypothetical protein
MQSIENKMVRRILGMGKGAVFSPGTFLDLGSRRAVDIALHRLVKIGKVRRLTRGLYDYPQHHRVFGVVYPSPEEVAKAIAGKEAVRFQPSGAYAANLLGLSDQVPAKIVFLTEGRAKRVRIGRQEIVLKRTSPRNMATAGRISGLIIQALRYLGRGHVDDQTVAKLKHKLAEADRRALLKDVPYAPAWIGEIMKKTAEPT